MSCRPQKEQNIVVRAKKEQNVVVSVAKKEQNIVVPAAKRAKYNNLRVFSHLGARMELCLRWLSGWFEPLP